MSTMYKLGDILYNKINNVINVDSAVLHEPMIDELDYKGVLKSLKSGFVSSVGKDIEAFENKISKITGAKYVVATCNGTSAYHLALKALGLKEGHEFFVPACSYISICNGLKYCNADPHFVDIELDNFGICPVLLDEHIRKNCVIRNKKLFNKKNGKIIIGLTIFHNLGIPSKIEELLKIAKKYNLKVIEDSAEALGSFYKQRHLGTFGEIGILSFNGNKVITTGGGGAVLTNNLEHYKYVLNISKTAKKKHQFYFDYNDVGYNYRMPNINAALGLSQIKKLKSILKKKKKLSEKYRKEFKKDKNFEFIFHSNNKYKSNLWLNSILLKKPSKKKLFQILNYLNKKGYNCRPIWKNASEITYFKKNSKAKLKNTQTLSNSLISIPSSPNL